MQIFVCGTGTDVGKTIICSWLCLKTQYEYFKPIQTGANDVTDSQIIHEISGTKVHNEIYSFAHPLSPHAAAHLEKKEINMNNIILPQSQNLIIEGAGGVMVPLNNKHLMLDLMEFLNKPVIVVTKSELGTINHTLLTLEVLKRRKIQILGVIMNGPYNSVNKQAIEFYGNVSVLAEMPFLNQVNREALERIPLSKSLQTIFNCN